MPSFSDPGFLQRIAAEMKALATEAGTGCDCPGCDNLTLGHRCDACSRRLCAAHTFFNLTGARVTPLCAYCVVTLCGGLFDDGDDADDDGDDGDDGDGDDFVDGGG